MIGDSQAQSKFIGEVLKLITGTSFIVIGILVLVVAVHPSPCRRSAGRLLARYLERHLRHSAPQ